MRILHSSEGNATALALSLLSFVFSHFVTTSNRLRNKTGRAKMNKSKVVLVALLFLLVLASALQVKIVNGFYELDHFKVEVVGSPQTEGIEFMISITAQDAYDNTVTNYAGTNTLTISQGIINPSSITGFSNGFWSGFVTVSQHGDSITISTLGANKSGTSNPFKVDKNINLMVVDHFAFDYISGPQTAGISFYVSITAKDVDGETVTTYYGTNLLEASVGTITPSTITFSKGNWQEQVTLSQGGDNVYISTTGQGKSGTSNIFRVDSNSGFFVVLIVVAVIIIIVAIAAVIGYKKVLRRPKKPPALARSPRSST